MKKHDALMLKADDVVVHRYYGKCRVVNLMFATMSDYLMGVVILPTTDAGLDRLQAESGSYRGTPLLEDSLRRLSKEAV